MDRGKDRQGNIYIWTDGQVNRYRQRDVETNGQVDR